MLEFIAFVCVIAQLNAFAQRKMLTGWCLCLAACGLYLLVAAEKQMFWMGVQQIVIGIMALAALRRAR